MTLKVLLFNRCGEYYNDPWGEIRLDLDEWQKEAN